MQATLPGVGVGEMKDTQFMSAKDKRQVLKAWERFLAGGLLKEHFTKALYEHLSLHCSFIAHYDKGGFYGTYFTSGDRIADFLSHFDHPNVGFELVPPSNKYGHTWWVSDDNGDINVTMIQIAARYIPRLLEKARGWQKAIDLEQARRLLAKHGLEMNLPNGETKLLKGGTD